MEAQVGRNLLVLATEMRQQDDREAVSELAILGGAACRLELLDLGLGQ